MALRAGLALEAVGYDAETNFRGHMIETTPGICALAQYLLVLPLAVFLSSGFWV